MKASWDSSDTPEWIGYEFDPPVLVKPPELKSHVAPPIPRIITIVDVMTGEEETIDLRPEDDNE